MDIQEKLKVTFVIVTHDQEEAMTVSSRIGVMDSGNLIQVATPAEIYEAPINKDVADFIGDVNILKGTYKGQNKIGTQLLSDDSNSIVYATQKVDAAIGNQIWFALRPEKLEISKTLPKNEHNILKGMIEDIAYGGSFSTYHVKLKNGAILKAIRANRERTKEHHLTWGDEVFLQWAPHSAVVLLS
jgi:putrescine transport system ATP-binding protein